MANLSRRSASLLVGLALVCVVGGLTLWLPWADERDQQDCPVRVRTLEPSTQFVGREELLPAGSVGAQRRELVAGLSDLGPLGPVSAGRFFDDRTEVPALTRLGDRLGLVTAPQGEPATLTVVDLAPEVPATEWAVELAPRGAPWSSFAAGPVGEDWVSVFSGADPTLVSLDEEGEAQACRVVPLEAGDDDVVAVTDQAAEEVVVLASAATAGSWLGVIDPTDGQVGASRRADGPQTWQDVAVADGLVVGSRWAAATVGTSGEPAPGDAQEPWLTAWDLQGQQRWTYPAASEPAFPSVLLELGDDGTSYVVSFDRGGPWLDAVDAQGQRRWRARLEPGEWSGSLWDDLLVVRGPAPQGGPMLRAIDVRDGQERWRVTRRQAPPIGFDPRSGFGSPLTDDEAHWVPSPNGLLRVDRRTDTVRRVDSRVPVEELVRIGGRVLVRSGPAVLVTG